MEKGRATALEKIDGEEGGTVAVDRMKGGPSLGVKNDFSKKKSSGNPQSRGLTWKRTGLLFVKANSARSSSREGEINV